MSISDAHLEGLINAVRSAGQNIIVPGFRNLSPDQVATKTDQYDFVTTADKEAELTITKAARGIWPDALIVGEEAVADTPEILDHLDSSDVSIIIDPIDGTGNFVCGLPVFGTIVAVCRQGVPVFGLLYDPLADTWIYAVQGAGVRFVDPSGAERALPKPPLRAKEDSRGYVPIHLFLPQDRDALASKITKFARATTLSCSCHEYRQIALAGADFCLSPSPKPWDHAAGALIATEGGGVAVSETGAPYRPGVPSSQLLVLANRDSPIGFADFNTI
ncbi:inositol monophosphatase [Pacificibacter sp. AS14]|uniref:inositol monophosphatase family protein n=1 Tax=Pacificibacter sp. AS14 TaxID=3135785 RepID=UPI003179BBA5